MAQFYHIDVNGDVQVVQVSSDDVGQLLLNDDSVILKDGSQVVYQTVNPQSFQPQQQTRFVIDDTGTQQQPSLSAPSVQTQLQQQQQQTFQLEPQPQTFQLEQQQQPQQQQQTSHVQQQSNVLQNQHQKAPAQQLYYATDQILHAAPQQPAPSRSPSAAQQSQQQHQTVTFHTQHSNSVSTVTHQPQQQQQQLLYRMTAQPTTQQQQSQTQQQSPQLNTHVIVQPSGQQMLIQTSGAQQRFLYQPNRLIFTQQTQTSSTHQTPLPPQPQQQQQQQLQLQQGGTGGGVNTSSAVSTTSRFVPTRQQSQQISPQCISYTRTIQSPLQLQQQPQQPQQQQLHQPIQTQLLVSQGTNGIRTRLTRTSNNNNNTLIARAPGCVPNAGGLRNSNPRMRNIYPGPRQPRVRSPFVVNTSIPTTIAPVATTLCSSVGQTSIRPRVPISAVAATTGAAASLNSKMSGAQQQTTVLGTAQVATSVAATNTRAIQNYHHMQVQTQQPQQQQQYQQSSMAANKPPRVLIRPIDTNENNNNTNISLQLQHQPPQYQRLPSPTTGGSPLVAVSYVQQPQQQANIANSTTTVAPIRNNNYDVDLEASIQAVVVKKQQQQQVQQQQQQQLPQQSDSPSSSHSTNSNQTAKVMAYIISKHNNNNSSNNNSNNYSNNLMPTASLTTNLPTIKTPTILNGVTNNNNNSAAPLEDENRMIRMLNGTCLTLAEYRKRQSAASTLTSVTSSTPTAGTTPISGGCNNTNQLNTSTPLLNGINPMRNLLRFNQNSYEAQSSSSASSSSLTNTPGSNQLVPSRHILNGSSSVNNTLSSSTASNNYGGGGGNLTRSQQPKNNNNSTSIRGSSSINQTSHNNYEIQTANVILNRNNQAIADKDRNSAKMLVILVSGEQRLITFTLPRESCTVQDLLEQVSVPFDNTTTIQCVENPGANIDFVVSVGYSVHESPSELIARADQSLQLSKQQDNPGDVHPAKATTTSSTPSSTGLRTPSSVGSALSASNASNESIDQTPSSSSKTSAKDMNMGGKSSEEPPRKTVEGYYAVCKSCGFSSHDHAKCQRCKRVFLNLPKCVPCNKSATSANQRFTPSTGTSTDSAPEKKPRLGIVNSNLASSGANIRASQRGTAARCRNPRTVGRRNVEAEAVPILLSSDDENAINDEHHLSQTNENISNNTQNKTATPPLAFEPLINDEMETSVYANLVRSDVTEITNNKDILHTTLPVNTIRFSGYKFEPAKPVTFTSKGVQIVAPILGDTSKTSTLDIHKSEIVKIVANFSKQSESTLVLYMMRTCAIYVKGEVNMPITDKCSSTHSKNGNYQSYRLILQMDKVSEQARNVIKSIWDNMDEISDKDAQALMAREDESFQNNEANNSREVRLLMNYPPTGKGSIPVTTEDYLCLASNQYLNDIIIDFFLQWIMNNKATEAQRENAYAFSVFFYKRLTTLSKQSDVKQTAAQKRHARVKSWTKNVNIFEKDFIIVPINEQSHWFLAIICFPKLEGPVTFNENKPIEPRQLKKPRSIPHGALQIGSTTITPLTKREIPHSMEGRGGSHGTAATVANTDNERDEAEADDSELSEESDNDVVPAAAASSSSEQPKTASGSTATTSNNNFSNKAYHREPIKQPMILIFDSLAGASRSRVVATLRDYLSCEYRAKMPNLPPRVFNKHTMPGHCLQVPQQPNFTDCGLYLLQFAEQFFNDPIRDYRMPIKQLANWFDVLTAARKREEIAIVVKKLAVEQKRFLAPKLTFPDIPLPTLNGEWVEPPELNDSLLDGSDGVSGSASSKLVASNCAKDDDDEDYVYDEERAEADDDDDDNIVDEEFISEEADDNMITSNVGYHDEAVFTQDEKILPDYELDTGLCATAVIPTIGRQIVVKRRLLSSSSTPIKNISNQKGGNKRKKKL